MRSSLPIPLWTAFVLLASVAHAGSEVSVCPPLDPSAEQLREAVCRPDIDTLCANIGTFKLEIEPRMQKVSNDLKKMLHDVPPTLANQKITLKTGDLTGGTTTDPNKTRDTGGQSVSFFTQLERYQEFLMRLEDKLLLPVIDLAKSHMNRSISEHAFKNETKDAMKEAVQAVIPLRPSALMREKEDLAVKVGLLKKTKQFETEAAYREALKVWETRVKKMRDGRREEYRKWLGGEENRYSSLKDNDQHFKAWQAHHPIRLPPKPSLDRLDVGGIENDFGNLMLMEKLAEMVGQDVDANGLNEDETRKNGGTSDLFCNRAYPDQPQKMPQAKPSPFSNYLKKSLSLPKKETNPKRC